MQDAFALRRRQPHRGIARRRVPGAPRSPADGDDLLVERARPIEIPRSGRRERIVDRVLGVGVHTLAAERDRPPFKVLNNPTLSS